ncbi:lipoate--protein ligase family protein [bacterium]|nr:lipoate--protein ligase family protein [candidate division CSSED10-310 bacterium]
MVNMSKHSWHLIIDSPKNASWNMAIDEYLLERVTETGTPVLRLYSWQPAALSLGYAQIVKRHVNIPYCKENGIQIVRRLTGGKAVLHDKEMTYAVVGEIGKYPFEGTLLDSYRLIAGAFLKSLQLMGMSPEMVPHQQRADSGGVSSCFEQPSAYEITVNARKILGSAQKRGRQSVLQHGSLLMNYDHNRWYNCLRNSTLTGSSRVTSLAEALGQEPSWDLLVDIIIRSFEDVLSVSFNRMSLAPADLDYIENYCMKNYPDLSFVE